MGFWGDLFGGNFSQAGHDLGASAQGILGPGGAGLIPGQIDPSAAGGAVDTSLPDEDRARQQQLIAILQQQAAQGNQAAIQQLRDATAKSQATSMAIGQSQPGVGYQTALRNIQNAQGAASQREAGQEQMLKAQSQLSAQDQLAQLLGGQGSQDILQSEMQQQAAQGIRQANLGMVQGSQQNLQNLIGSASMGFAKGATMSKGGIVPDKKKLKVDDPRRDTVKAKLSPEEIIIPRSIALRPDAPMAAAKFVAAIKAKHVQHLAGGGDAGTGISTQDPGQILGNVDWSTFLLNPLGAISKAEGMAPQAPSIQNGGLLNTQPYMDTRGQQAALAQLMAQRAAGNGPSVVGQELQDATDANIQGALGAGAGSRANPALLSAILGGAGAAQQGAAGAAGQGKLGEMTKGQEAQGRLQDLMRTQSLGLAGQQQQAAFQNTLTNAGINLQQQQMLMKGLSAAGQAGSFAASRSGGQETTSDQDLSELTNANQAGYQGNPGEGSSASEWNTPDSGPSGPEPGTPDWASAYGGEVPDETDKHIYVKKKDGSTIKVAKKGMSEEALSKLRGFDGGGLVPASDPDMQRRERIKAGSNEGASAAGPKEVTPYLTPPTDIEAGSGNRTAERQAGSRPQPRPHLYTARAPRAPLKEAEGGEIPPSAPGNNIKVQLGEPQILSSGRNKRSGESQPKDGQKPRNTGADAGGGWSFGAAGGGEVGYSGEGGDPAAQIVQEAVSGSRPDETFSVVQPANDEPARERPGDPVILSAPATPLSGAELFGNELGEKPKPYVDPRFELRDNPNIGPTPPIETTFVRNADNSVTPVQAVVSQPLTTLRPQGAGGSTTRQGMGGAGGTGSGGEKKSGSPTPYDYAVEAQLQKGDAEAREAANQAKALGAYQSELETQAIEDKQMRENAAAQSQEMLRNYRTKLADAERTSGVIDPNHFWADRNMGQKVAAVIGTFLGGLSGGPNQALALLEKASDRDIDAQKANLEQEMQRKRMGLEGARSLYGMAHEMTQDDIAARNMARAAIKEKVANQLDMIAKTSLDPQKRADATMAAAQIRIGQKQNEDAAAQRHIENQINSTKATADLIRAEAEGAKSGAGAQAQTEADVADRAAAEHYIDTQMENPLSKKAEREGLNLARVAIAGTSGRKNDTEEQQKWIKESGLSSWEWGRAKLSPAYRQQMVDELVRIMREGRAARPKTGVPTLGGVE